MHCVNCGQQLSDDANFCLKCGQSLQPESEKVQPQWESCVIDLGYVKKGWFVSDKVLLRATATGPKGEYIVQDSSVFDVIHGYFLDAPINVIYIEPHLKLLVDKLVNDGWEPLPQAATGATVWYVLRFRRIVK